MNYRALGGTGLRVSEIGLGCASLGGGVFYRDDREARRILDRSFELGVNFYDMADTYGYGHVEALVGRAFAGRRDRVILTSKAGYLPSSLGRFGRILAPVAGPVRSVLQPWKSSLKKRSKSRQDFSPQHVTRAVERSLARLGTDYLDLFLLHSPPRSVIEEGAIFDVLDVLRSQGKIRFYGVSARTVEDALLCLRHPACAAVQVVFNLIEPEAAAELLPAARSRTVGVIARIPLGRGILTDSAKIKTGHLSEAAEDLEKAAARRRDLSFLVEAGPVETGARDWPSAALRFVLDHPEVSTAIPGTSCVAHLEANIRAATAPPLTAGEHARIAAL